jgi:hypothetical protein
MEVANPTHADVNLQSVLFGCYSIWLLSGCQIHTRQQDIFAFELVQETLWITILSVENGAVM